MHFMDLCGSQGVDPYLEWQIVAWPYPIMLLRTRPSDPSNPNLR